jgi:hypothetical protein
MKMMIVSQLLVLFFMSTNFHSFWIWARQTPTRCVCERELPTLIDAFLDNASEHWGVYVEKLVIEFFSSLIEICDCCLLSQA